MGDPAYNIETASFTDVGFSDDFSSTTLDPQWTAVGTSSGTVDLINGTASPIYDLTTRPGTLLLQCPANGSDAALRIDDTLADGEQLVVAFSPGGTDQSVNNSANFRLGINDTDTGTQDGNYYILYYDGEDNGNIKVFDGTTVLAGTLDGGFVVRRSYLRIVRSGTDLYFMVSGNGAAWRVLDNQPLGSRNNVWISCLSGAIAGFDPIMAVHWIRHTTYDGYDAF